MGRVLHNYDDLAERRARLEDARAYVVTTCGFFDVLTLGHVNMLEETIATVEGLTCEVAHGDIALIVGVDATENWDAEHLQAAGKRRPVVPTGQRCAIVAALEAVTYTVPMLESPPSDFLKAAKPHFHAKGRPWTLEALPEHQLVQSLGGMSLIIETQKGGTFASTSALKEAIVRDGLPQGLLDLIDDELKTMPPGTDAFRRAAAKVLEAYWEARPGEVD